MNVQTPTYWILAAILLMLNIGSFTLSRPDAASLESIAQTDTGTLTDIIDQIRTPDPSMFQSADRRPVFSPTRRPDPEITQNGLTGWRLNGVVSSGSIQLALLYHQKTKERKRLSTGDMIEGWKLTAIEDGSAVFVNDEGSMLSLRKATPGS